MKEFDLTKVEDIEESTNVNDFDKEHPYARIFSQETSYMYNHYDESDHVIFIMSVEQIANKLLKKRGYLFLNEAYDMLGLKRSKAGQVVGWVYDKNNSIGDNYVDFGLREEYNRDFINGKRYGTILDFNVDGNVYDILEKLQ